jgi:hypothetical protein
MKRFYYRGLVPLLAILLTAMAADTFAQTLMPLPPHSSVYSGSARGYWFTAPTNFTIVGLRVPSQAGTGAQYIHVMKCNDPLPVAFTSQSSNFNTLTYISGATNGVIQTVNINVSMGDVIGILGTAGTGNSYATGGYNTTINGFPIKLTRFGYQGNINTGPAPSYWGEALNNTGSISRVEMYYTVGPPCTMPSGLAASNITSATADLSWTAVSGSVGYDYVVDQNAGNPSIAGTATTNTSFTETGLIPSTNYFLHVRNKCSSTSISQWVHEPFTTLPPCEPPIGFFTSNLMPTSTTINWAAWPSAVSYDYVVDQSSADPTGSTGLINTLATNAPIPGLTENTWYYVHLRSQCAGNESSAWGLDSFLTPIVCRAPDVQIDYINVDEAVAYWDAVPTAYEYEYAISTSATPPTLGTKYKFLSIHTSALNDGVEYFIHVRSNCESVGSKSSSDWRTVSFKTFPLAVGNPTAGNVGIVCYPNPVQSLLNIKIAGAYRAGARIVMSDIAGKVIKTMEVKSGNVSIDMKEVAAGTYIVQYVDNEYKTQVLVHKQ